MTEEELAKIPRQTVEEVATAIPGGPGYHHRLLVAMEAHANIEWWRGFHSGQSQLMRHFAEVRDLLGDRRRRRNGSQSDSDATNERP